jgi:ActR/RegA family two-component response regulator
MSVIERTYKAPKQSGPAPFGAPRSPLTILIIEDDFGDFDATFRALRKMDAYEPEIIRARSIIEARQAAAKRKIDIAFVDYHLGPDSGLVFLKENGGRIGGALTILLTGAVDSSVQSIALDAGAIACLNKRDMSTSLLENTIRSALHTHKLERQLQSLIAGLGMRPAEGRSHDDLDGTLLLEIVQRAESLVARAAARDDLDRDDAAVILKSARRLVQSRLQ